MISRDAKALVLVTTLSLYTLIVVILGGVDTLANNGSDRAIQTAEDLLYVTIPLVVILFGLFVSFLRNKKREED